MKLTTKSALDFTVLEKIICIVILFIYVNNLFLDIMKIDAAQYASISLEMLQNDSYLQVYDLQNDYLDKPPLLFWISSLSLKVIGICNFAYKIGAFIFLLFSLYAIFKFTENYYNKNIAKNAVLIYATCQAFFQMSSDIRTDGILTSCVIISIWLITEYWNKNKIIYLILAAVFTAFAMMAKGPIGFIAVLMPIGIHLLYQKQWKRIFNLSWLFFVFIVIVLLIPMSYGLYTQFDLHPEKIINGKLHQSGLYFYYWLQSFGRITGENIWNNGLPWHFFIGSISWDFFPWIVILYAGLFFQFKKIITKNSTRVPEIITISGFVLLFVLLSMSKYKLPHYIFVTLPFASIISATYIDKLNPKQLLNWERVYFAFGILVAIVITIYPLFFFTEVNYLIYFLLLLQLFLLIKIKKLPINGIFRLIGYVLVLNVFLSYVFYPKLLTYQADAIAGKWFYENKRAEKVYFINEKSHLFNFYTKDSKHQSISLNDLDTIKSSYWLYTNQDNLLAIQKNKTILEKKEFVDYPITRLKLKFLLESKRQENLKYYYLLKIK
jgi:4-amino-4-deoxy-L-arabinose transferase-like glycosyltransferase